MWLSQLSVTPVNLKKVDLLAVTILFCLVLLLIIPTFHLWQHPLNLPLNYSKDSLFSLMIVKNMVENHGFSLKNPNLGYPDGQNLADFPMFDAWQIQKIWWLSWLTKDVFLIQNIFFLLSFFPLALSAYYVLRRLEISVPFAILGSWLFSFLPYHLLNNTNQRL